MNEGSQGARAGSRRRWLIVVGACWLLGAVGVFFLHGWLLDEIVSQAGRRGVALSGCQLDLGISRVGLEACQFSLRPDGRVLGAALTGVAASGSIERIDIDLDGFSPERLRVRGAHASLRGQPRLNEWFRSAVSRPSLELPVDVEQSAVSFFFEPDAPAVVELTDIGFDADSSRLLARFEVVRRAHGQMSLGPEGVEITLGAPTRPEVRFILRVLPRAERAEISLDLHRVPLRSLEGSWLQMTDTLRPVELEGRIFATVPLGLSVEVPTGDVHLTLHGLQFPIPRELEGLVYQSPPKVSGRFVMSRAFDRATFADLSFLTGELAMRGDAEIEVDEKGLLVKARANGPLPCRSIAQSAASAHADSPLAQLAGALARRVLNGSVDVLAAIDAHTSNLEAARVLTSIGVGCGLQPLPIDVSLPASLLERLPIDVVQRLPRIDALPAPRIPRARASKSRAGASPRLLRPDADSDTSP